MSVSRPCERCHQIKRCTLVRLQGRPAYLCRPCARKACRLTRTPGTKLTAARLSPAMRDIVQVCREATGGLLAVADLVNRRIADGEHLLVVRASLSRTLRRLWRIGLVELSAANCPENAMVHTHETMTAHAKEWNARADDPAAYRKVRAFRQASGMAPPKDRAAYRVECLDRAEREVRVRYVVLTEAGRGWLAVNSGPRARVNRSEKMR